MSDGKQRRLIPAWRAILLAMVAGALAGAVAVYVRGAVSGNTPAEIAVRAQGCNSRASPADDACAAKAESAKTVAAAATGQVAAMLPADPPQSLAALAFNGPDRQADDAGRACRQDRSAQPLGDMVRALSCRNAGARCAAEGGRQRRFRGHGGQCRYRRRHQAEEVPGRDQDRLARLLPREHARPVQRSEAARPGARPAGDAIDRQGRLPARLDERPRRMVGRGCEEADRGGAEGRADREHISASAPGARRDSRRSRGRPCGRASPPRHISPAAGRGDISNPKVRHAAPA